MKTETKVFLLFIVMQVMNEFIKVLGRDGLVTYQS